MKLQDVENGKEYWHDIWGRILVIGHHPHDGACVIVERQETTDPDDDDHAFASCEASDLSVVEPGDQWPFLGFTTQERSARKSREWGERHGFVQIPEGSGQWFYNDATRVPSDVWDAAWKADFDKS